MTFGHILWALTISWSRLLARVQSGPECHMHDSGTYPILRRMLGYIDD